jgi:xanthine dehydrogenase YagT iron-sulfur-binding subunit
MATHSRTGLGAVGGRAVAPTANVVEVALRVNGAERRLAIEPRVTLLDALREYAGLPGTKKGCDQGQCGACTVHLDGRCVLACLTLACQAEGHEVTTIEGLADAGGTLHPVQAAFVDHDAFQCGYCTAGQVMSAMTCIQEGHLRTDADIRDYMSGNLCRCGAYPNIVAAVRAAAERMGLGRAHD